MARTVFRGGRVFDGSATLAAADVVVEDGRIVDVGPGLDGDEAVELAGRAVLPGMFDCHTHVMVSPDRLDTNRELETPFSYWFYVAIENLRRTLAIGITTVRDAGFADLGIKTAVADGLIAGPRLHIATTILSQSGGHADGWLPSGYDITPLSWPGMPSGIVDGPDEMRRRAREIIRAGADQIKVCTSGGVLSPRDDPRHGHFRDEELAVLVEEATAAGIPVMAHAQGAPGIKAAVRAGIRSIEHGIFLDDEAIEMMLERGTWLVPTLLAPQGVLDAVAAGAAIPAASVRKATEVIDIHRAAVRAGDRGRRQGRHGHRLRRHAARPEPARAGAHGRVRHDAARRRCWRRPVSAAELLGVERRLRARIEPGKRADLVVVDGDPFDYADLADARHGRLPGRAPGRAELPDGRGPDRPRPRPGRGARRHPAARAHALRPVADPEPLGLLAADRRRGAHRRPSSPASAAVGGTCLVDVTLDAIGRDPARLRRLAEASGLHLVMGCGWYRQAYYPAEARIGQRTVDDLADELVGEFRDGVRGTGVRPGIIGEIGTDKPWLTGEEERVHRAAARAARRTGMAVTTHAVMSDVGLAQLRVFEEEGLDPGACRRRPRRLLSRRRLPPRPSSSAGRTSSSTSWAWTSRRSSGMASRACCASCWSSSRPATPSASCSARTSATTARWPPTRATATPIWRRRSCRACARWASTTPPSATLTIDNPRRLLTLAAPDGLIGMTDVPGPGLRAQGLARDAAGASASSRSAARPIAFVDLAVRPMAPTELRRFADRLGADALVDREGRRFRELGLAWLQMDDKDLLRRLLDDQRLLRLPLVRRGDAFAAGVDEAAWKRLLAVDPASAARAPQRRSRRATTPTTSATPPAAAQNGSPLMKLPGMTPRPWPIQTSAGRHQQPADDEQQPRDVELVIRLDRSRDQYGSTACQSRPASSRHSSPPASDVPFDR